MANHIPKASLKLLYNNRNITTDVSDALLSFSYTDKLRGESDELSISIEDKNKLWMHEWYPEKGAVLYAEIIYKGVILPCGNFTIDELELSGPPTIVSIRALAAHITKKLRTKQTTAHEDKTLAEIARNIGAKYGFTVVGDIPDIRISRVTQYQQTDLRFLHALAHSYGLVFSVRDKILTFTSIYNLESANVVISLDSSALNTYSIRDKTTGTFRNARLQYHNVTNDELVSHTEDNTQEDIKEDTLELRGVTAENTQQAATKAKAALHNANREGKEGTITTEGNPLLVAGNNIALTRLGALSGIYSIQESIHNVDKSAGYVTAINIKRVGTIERGLQKPL